MELSAGSIVDGLEVAWVPTDRQAEFLSCDDYEVLYGGAAGGGKTDSLIIDAWCMQHDGANNQNHRAIIFRRTYKDLADLIDRGCELFPKFIPGVEYNANDHVFETPAGAKLYVGHLQHDKNRLDYKGRNFNYIGFEELTQWATPACWEYLKSRNRSTDRTLPCYVRATTNPDGPGQRWVMKHWGIQADGGATRIVQMVETEVWDEQRQDWTLEMRPMARRFIPARLAENPHLRGTGYRERLLLMPPEERDALLKGLWAGNKVAGAYYMKQMAEARIQGRIGRVPWLQNIPVNTFWDLGWNDTTAIWFHQYAAMCNRFPSAYENSGETLEHYASLLQQTQQEHGIVYGTHYLPHDADHGNLQTGKSAVQRLRELLPGHRFVVVPRIDNVQNGIQQTRSAFPTCWFDAEECADALAALDAYRKRWNNATESWSDEPMHDQFSNYADAFRQFGQGYVPKHRTVNAATGEVVQPETRARRKRDRNWRTA